MRNRVGMIYSYLEISTARHIFATDKAHYGIEVWEVFSSFCTTCTAFEIPTSFILRCSFACFTHVILVSFVIIPLCQSHALYGWSSIVVNQSKCESWPSLAPVVAEKRVIHAYTTFANISDRTALVQHV